MKKLLCISFIIVCLFILYWCIPSGRYLTNLYDIETRFNQSPAEIWEELQLIPRDKLSRKESALYNLLLTKAQMAKDSLALSDSLINATIAYYKENKDSIRLSQAYYYKGNIFKQKKYYIQAIECYENAEKYATDKNLEMKYLLNQIMGKIYHFKMMYEDEKKAKEEAVRYAQLLKDSLFIEQSLTQMAKYYNVVNNYEYSINELQRAKQIMPASNYQELASPVLLKSQNKQGAMHLKEEEWKIIVENTDACFNGFTSRIKSEYPQLTEEDIQFCCLIKMELSISLLSEIYHIAKTSISRKKVRLKEKMGIETITIDEFIHDF